jgi:alpha-mannosidase
LPASAEEFLREVLAPAVYPHRVPLDVSARPLEGEPEPPARAVAGPFAPFAVGDRWGGMWSTTWFRFSGRVPDGWAGQEVAAVVHLGGARTVGFSAEGLIWTPDLVPVQGLHHRHREYLLATEARPGQEVDFYVEAAANPIPQWHKRDWPRLAPDYAGPPLYALEQADLAVVDRQVEALLVDAQVVLQIAESMPERAGAASEALDEAMGIVKAGGPDAVAAARRALAPVLAPGPGAGHNIVAVGHAHIDTAWLWPVRETRRKCARTFANQLRLLDRYPEHHFVCSQAVQYQWMKDEYPALYERIKQAVSSGRWEPVGGMWVEADTNIPSGESLVRQFVHGRRFFRDELGVDTEDVWIPDVFGYSAALPQIARQAGAASLITQKMSWNDTNTFPHSTFWWEGHDGSRLLAHFPPADTYNGTFAVRELLADQRNFKDEDRSDLTLYPYGFGDGGGGPTARMLEAAGRLRQVEGLPPTRIGTLREFLRAVHAEGAASRLAEWVGELYLEYHRGTFTTHADVKRGNRRGEEALRAAEMWSVAAGLDRTEALEPLWKLLLLNQFHDIIPGSSINWVYEVTAGEHRRILDGTQVVVDEAQRALAGDGSGDRTGDGGLVAFNPSSYPRAEVIDLPSGQLAWLEVPACGWAPADPGSTAPWPGVEVGAGRLDNGLIRLTLDGSGHIVSVWDHEAGREVVAEGAVANLLQLHEDNPKAFDAWDVDREYLDDFADLVELESMEVAERHPLRGAIRLTRRFGRSSLTQLVRLRAGSRRVDFVTEVDWQERHRFLKVAFPVAIRSARATFEIQHGHIERPTVANTTWDEARFEVCAHRWAELSEPGYGVALLNDCKYGYDVRGHTLRLSLLRGPGYPDPEADRGRHRFTYSLLPHPGDLRAEGRVIEEAEALNLPVTVRPGRAPAPGAVVSVAGGGVSVEAVKWADDRGGVIVRICEVHGGRRRIAVSLNRPWARVSRTDILEQASTELDPEGRRVALEIKPFELVTLLFQ